MNKQSYSLEYLAAKLEAEIKGDPSIEVSGLATLQSANGSQLSFLANPVYEKYLEPTNAAAVILSPSAYESVASHDLKFAVLVHSQPYLAYAKLSRLWEVKLSVHEDSDNVHSSAVVHESAQVSESAIVCAGVIIHPGVTVAEGAVIGSNCVIGEDSIIGKNTLLHANVTLYHGISLGSNCIVHSGAVIGSDGFGFAPNNRTWEKIAQLGGVVVEDDVEIGANTAIDRGALDNTVIEQGVKLDNQIQIAHNVRVGKNTAMAACCAVAGSTTIGQNCVIGGASGIAGHLTIVDNVHITAMTMVIKNLKTAGVYSSGTGVQPNDKWRKSIARLRQLDKMAKRLSALEKSAKN